jgi:Tripartite tricarboxylate transporter TctB family
MSNRKSARIADALYAVALIVVAGLVLREAGTLAPAPFDPLGPKTFPIWISYGLIALALAMLARLAAGRDLGWARQSMVLGLDETADHVRRPWVSLALFGLTVLYVTALSVRGIGFMIATGVYLLAAGLTLSHFERRPFVPIAVASVVAAVALDLIFRRVFALDLP